VSAPGISVIVPAYNVAGYVAEAFASIAAQSVAVEEIVAVDDGSTDGTAQWLHAAARADRRVRLLVSDRLGPGGARNAGLAAASQPVIAFLDADDVWPRRKLEQQLERLAAADRPDVVAGMAQRCSAIDPGTLLPAATVGAAEPTANLGAYLFRRQVFDAVGRFEAALVYCEDVDLMFRVREAGLRVAVMREVALYYRIRPGSLTQTADSEVRKERDALLALRRSIRRRRASGVGDLPSFASLIDE